MTEKNSAGDAPAMKAEVRKQPAASKPKDPRLDVQRELDKQASKEAGKPVTYLPFERRVVALCKAEDYPGGVEMLLAHLTALHRWAQYREVTAEQFTQAVKAIEDVRFR